LIYFGLFKRRISGQALCGEYASNIGEQCFGRNGLLKTENNGLKVYWKLIGDIGKDSGDTGRERCWILAEMMLNTGRNYVDTGRKKCGILGKEMRDTGEEQDQNNGELSAL
jgi:hypothetical protein